MPQMPTPNYQAKAMGLVRAYVERTLDKSDPDVDFDVFIVWFCKTLQNWKALVSTTLPDSTYYEVTYNGNEATTYLDVYRKVENIALPDFPKDDELINTHWVDLQ